VPDSGQKSPPAAIRVLIVAPSGRAREDLERTLRGAGLETWSAVDLAEAIPALLGTPLDAVLCRLDGPACDALVEWVASHKPSVRVLVTGAPDDEFFLRYADVESLVVRVEASDEEIVSELESIGVRRGFFGSGIEIELFDYVQMIALTGRDKVIQIDTPAGTATIWFEHGDVVHVEYGDFRGEMAFYKILSESRGAFRESYWRSPPRRTVTRSSTHLLMEAARQSDEGTLGMDAVPEAMPDDPETSFADLAIESTGIDFDQVGSEAANDGRASTPKAKGRSQERKKGPDAAARMRLRTRPVHHGAAPVRVAKAPSVKPPRARAPLRPMASDNEDEDFAALVEDSLSDQLDEVHAGAIEASDQFQLGLSAGAPEPLPVEDSLRNPEESQAGMSTAAGHAILDDPDTRAVMLEQFWQFEGINGVAIISSTGKVLAEDMQHNSSLVTLAGFYMRGAARIARALGHNVFDGVVARSASGQKMVMVGMGAASAVLSVEPEADPESVRDAVMGVE
jgi:hypothetical protein